MTLLRNMRKKSAAITATVRVILVALMVSLVFAPFAFSAGSVNGCGMNKNANVEQVACHGCCSSKLCCSMKKSDAPQAPQPLGTARAASAQQLLNGLPAFNLPLLYELPFAKTQVRFSHEEFSHRSTAPLAQSCIRLI